MALNNSHLSARQINHSSIEALAKISPSIITKSKEESHSRILKHISDIEIIKYEDIETIPGKEISDEMLRRMISLYREDFGYKINGAWGEYLKCSCPDCNTVLSIQDAYHLNEQEYVPLTLLEEEHVINAQCDNHPGKQMDYFWNEEVLFRSFDKKYRQSDDCILSILEKDEDIIGFTIAYPSTLATTWEYEFEQLYPGKYETYKKGLEKTLQCEVNDSMPVYAWNLVEVRNPYRAGPLSKMLINKLGEQVPEHYRTLPIPTEMDLLNPYTCTLLACGAEVVYKPGTTSNALGLLARQVKDFAMHFSKKTLEEQQEFKMLRSIFKKLQENNWTIDPSYTDMEWLHLRKALPKQQPTLLPN